MEIPFQGQLDESMLRRMTVTAVRPTRGRFIWILVFAGFFAWGLIIFPWLHGQAPDPIGFIPFLVIAGALI